MTVLRRRRKAAPPPHNRGTSRQQGPAEHLWTGTGSVDALIRDRLTSHWRVRGVSPDMISGSALTSA